MKKNPTNADFVYEVFIGHALELAHLAHELLLQGRREEAVKVARLIQQQTKDLETHLAEHERRGSPGADLFRKALEIRRDILSDFFRTEEEQSE